MHPFECQIALATGRIISVHELHIARTYARLEEGVPDRSYNERLIEDARSRMIAFWGKRPTYVFGLPFG